MAWSPDGLRLATGGAQGDGTVRVWDPDALAEPLAALARHQGGVSAVAWSPDGRRLATGGADIDGGTVRICDPDSGKALAVLAGHEGWMRSVAWSPDGGRARVGGGRVQAAVVVWLVEGQGGLSVAEASSQLAGVVGNDGVEAV